MPREGEWLKLANPKMGDYFAFQVREITHREGSPPEVVLDRLPPNDEANAPFNESELDEYVTSYVDVGWLHRSTVTPP
jgi:hypothetical protein